MLVTGAIEKLSIWKVLSIAWSLDKIRTLLESSENGF